MPDNPEHTCPGAGGGAQEIIPASVLGPRWRFTAVVLAPTAWAIGCNLEFTLAYAVGAYGGRRAVERWDRYLLLDPDDRDRADRFFHHFGGMAALVARLVPVIGPYRLASRHRADAGWQVQLYAFAGHGRGASRYVGDRLGDKWNTDPALRATMNRFDFQVRRGPLIFSKVQHATVA